MRSAGEEEVLGLIQGSGRQVLENDESERLRDRRVNTVENGAASRNLPRLGTTVREETAPGMSELGTGMPLRALQAPRECKVRELHRFAHRTLRLKLSSSLRESG